MALSFEESKKQLAQQAAAPMMMAAAPMVMSVSNEEESIAAYSGETSPHTEQVISVVQSPSSALGI